MAAVSSPEHCFRDIKEGCGGTFDFRDYPIDGRFKVHKNHDMIYRTGTSERRTCVAMYAKLGPKKCFMAHINTYVIEPHPKFGWHVPGDPPKNRRVIVEEGQQLEKDVFAHLQKHATLQGRSMIPDKSPVFVSCPMPTFENGIATTGLWVLEAVRKFFGVPKAQVKMWEAFVVNHRDGNVESLDFDRQAYYGNRDDY